MCHHMKQKSEILETVVLHTQILMKNNVLVSLVQDFLPFFLSHQLSQTFLQRAPLIQA